MYETRTEQKVEFPDLLFQYREAGDTEAFTEAADFMLARGDLYPKQRAAIFQELGRMRGTVPAPSITEVLADLMERSRPKTCAR